MAKGKPTRSDETTMPQTWEARTKFHPGGYCDTADAMKAMQEEIGEWRALCAPSAASVAWRVSAGWYWTFGRVAGMREATLMSARALLEDDQLFVYVGEAMTNRLSFPDPELPLQFRPAVLPQFKAGKFAAAKPYKLFRGKRHGSIHYH